MQENEEVKGAIVQRAGVISLNRASKLNVLNETMIDQLLVLLKDFQSNDQVDFIVIKGNGPKGFCAGGDVVSVVNAIAEGRDTDFFFKKEYHFDHSLYLSEKPIITLGHGFVIGGGFGVFSGGKKKYCASNSLFSMPEGLIGFFPDVASSYFLKAAPLRWRLLMAMCGAKVNAYWANLLGLTDGVFDHEEYEKVVSDICKKGDLAKSFLLDTPAEQVESFKEVDEVLKPIEEFLKVEDFHQWMLDLDQKSENQFLKACASQYLSSSRYSGFFTWELFQWSKEESLSRCFEMDLFLSQSFGQHHDFREGVRALLVDKDKRPKFLYTSYEEIPLNERSIMNNF